MTDTSIFSVRSWGQLRAFLYVVVPVVLAALNVANADVWIGLALAVLAPALAAVNTVDGFRKWFYGVLAAVQVVLTVVFGVSEAAVVPWVAVVVAVVGGAVAAPRVAVK